MTDFVPVLDVDLTLEGELGNVADLMVQGQIDPAIALWQGLLLESSSMANQPGLMKLGLRLLEQGDFEQRWLISNQLLKLGEGIIAPLLTLWQNPAAATELRWFAGRLLGKFVCPDITLALTAVFNQPEDQELWAIAAEGLGNQGEFALTVIGELLNNEDSRPLAARILAQLSHPDALPLLQNLVTDADPTIRAQALQALSQYLDEQLVPLFLQAIADPVANVRGQAVEALGLYLKSLRHQPDAAQALDILSQLHPRLMDLDPAICQKTAIAISHYPTAPSVEILAKTLASPYTPEPLRLTLIKCLGWMETRDSLDALASVFRSPFHGQSLADLTLVIQTLGRIKDHQHQFLGGKILLTFAQSDHPQSQNPELRKHLSHSWAQLRYLPARSLLQVWQNDADTTVKLHAQAALKRLAMPLPTTPPEAIARAQTNIQLR